MRDNLVVLCAALDALKTFIRDFVFNQQDAKQADGAAGDTNNKDGKDGNSKDAKDAGPIINGTVTKEYPNGMTEEQLLTVAAEIRVWVLLLLVMLGLAGVLLKVVLWCCVVLLCCCAVMSCFAYRDDAITCGGVDVYSMVSSPPYMPPPPCTHHTQTRKTLINAAFSPPSIEPTCNLNHHDYLLKEMRWLAVDVAQVCVCVGVQQQQQKQQPHKQYQQQQQHYHLHQQKK